MGRGRVGSWARWRGSRPKHQDFAAALREATLADECSVQSPGPRKRRRVGRYLWLASPWAPRRPVLCGSVLCGLACSTTGWRLVIGSTSLRGRCYADAALQLSTGFTPSPCHQYKIFDQYKIFNAKTEIVLYGLRKNWGSKKGQVTMTASHVKMISHCPVSISLCLALISLVNWSCVENSWFKLLVS